MGRENGDAPDEVPEATDGADGPEEETSSLERAGEDVEDAFERDGRP